jgi:hypothetical protein
MRHHDGRSVLELERAMIGLSGMVRRAQDAERVTLTPSLGIRVPQQDDIVHADPWSSGELQRVVAETFA